MIAGFLLGVLVGIGIGLRWGYFAGVASVLSERPDDAGRTHRKSSRGLGP